MTTYHPPTILTSRGIPGIVPSSASGNLAWNEDGQCMFISRRVVHILTPYLTSTLQPPANLVDPNLVLEYPISTVNKAKKRMEEDMDVDEASTPGPSTRELSGSSVKRMKAGEVKWWTTGIEVDKDGSRERLYNWVDAGDEYSAVITDKEATVRAAVWSPSGLSDLGGSLLAVLTSFGQISIYAPRMDPASKQWEEIFDLTMKTKILSDSEDKQPRTPMNETRCMLHLKSSCMRWSPAIDGDEITGCHASILAVASRAGTVSLWSQFKQETVVEVCSSFLTTMSWSRWFKDTDGYRSRLAMATSDGLVTLLDVIRTPVLGQSGDVYWKLEAHKATISGQSDRRNITSLYWHDSASLLVWTKPGSVSLCRDQAISSNWVGTRELRLQKVGNWAGANSINNCVGIQPFGKDRLLVTLAGLTQHLITDISTEPKLAPLTESLRLSVAVRDCFLEFTNDEGMNKDRHRMSAKDNKEMTANTGAFASVGPHAQLASWITEAVNFHNMDNATEGTRTLNFMVADLSGVFDDDQSVIEELKEVLSSPPSVILSSPLKTILPYCLRILARPDPATYSQDLLGLCKINHDSTSAPNAPADHRGTMHSMWKWQELNGLRHKLVIGQWCLTALNHRKADFTAAVWEITNTIRSLVQDILVGWTLHSLKSRQNPLDDRDRRFIGLLAKGYRDSERDRVTEFELKTLEGASGKTDSDQDEEKCPACSQPIVEGDIGVAKCVKGHEWARCSVTGFLITDSTYRVCNTCPAISLCPRRHLPMPIGVDADGLDSDWKRFAQPRDESLVEKLLESAVLCVMCGGRWVRAM